MPTLRAIHGGMWTEVKRVVLVDGIASCDPMMDGEPVVKQTTCCCAQPGATRRECSDNRPHPTKTACRCFCHDTKRLK